MQSIDIHSHLADDYFDESRDEVLAIMAEKQIGTISIGTDLVSSQRVVALAERSALVWACVGVHPENLHEGFAAAEYGSLLAHPRTVAVGECGFDYFRADDAVAARRAQRSLFEAQIECALAHDLPLMLHIRPSRGTLDAYHDALDILSSYKKKYPSLRGNSHFFAGDTEVAKQFFDLDFTISFTGVITFAREYDAVIAYAPPERMHAETDAPFVAPVPHRGKQCVPWMVEEVVGRIAEIKGASIDECAHTLLGNTKRLFALE